MIARLSARPVSRFPPSRVVFPLSCHRVGMRLWCWLLLMWVPALCGLQRGSAHTQAASHAADSPARDEPETVDVAAPPVAASSQALQEFLKRFDGLAQRGFVTTMRPGPTGIGYTLESLLGIAENNSPRGDFRGMEIKAHRLRIGQSERGKANLFLKEPVWSDPQTTAERIRRFGYRRDDGRCCWYQSVTSQVNERGLQLTVDRRRQQVELRRADAVIATWSFDVLQQRLREKLREVVFVGARTRGQGAREAFHYTSVCWCAEPSLDRFLNVLEDGDIILELRMHVKPTGGGRNHGTAFRIRPRRLHDLYQVQTQCRPLIRQSATDRQ